MNILSLITCFKLVFLSSIEQTKMFLKKAENYLLFCPMSCSLEHLEGEQISFLGELPL